MKKLIRLELRKIFSKRLTQLALVVVLLLSAFLAFSTYQNKYASDGAGNEGTGRTAVEIDKAVAARYSGILTDEKVQQMISEIVPKSGENGLNAIYCNAALYRRRKKHFVFATPSLLTEFLNR